MKQILLQCLALALFPVGLSAHADQVQSFGDYSVRYSAFNSSFLQPEVAKAYGLSRSRNRGVLMVTVQRDDEAVPARTRALVDDVVGRSQVVNLREVRAGESIYYVGGFSIIDGEMLRFTVDVFPEGTPQDFTVQFRQQLYTE